MSPLLDCLVDGMALPEDCKLIIKSCLRHPHPTARLMKGVTFERRDYGELVVSSDDFISKELKLGVGSDMIKVYKKRVWFCYHPEQGGESTYTRQLKMYVQRELMWRAEESGSCGGHSDN